MSVSTVILLIGVGSFVYYKYRQFVKWADNIPGHDEPFFSKPVFKALFAGRRSKCCMHINPSIIIKYE